MAERGIGDGEDERDGQEDAVAERRYELSGTAECGCCRYTGVKGGEVLLVQSPPFIISWKTCSSLPFLRPS